MLAKPDHRCIECGRAYGDPAFHHHKGRPQNGAAYWCDRGLLCSPACSLVHFRKRGEAGTLPTAPAPNPFQAFEAPDN